jgi:hypothetical protein
MLANVVCVKQWLNSFESGFHFEKTLQCFGFTFIPRPSPPPPLWSMCNSYHSITPHKMLNKAKQSVRRKTILVQKMHTHSSEVFATGQLKPPLHPSHSSNIPHLAEARHYGCNGTYQYRQVTTTIHSKNFVWFHYFLSGSTVQADHCYKTSQKTLLLSSFLLRNDYSGNIVGQDQESWMSDTAKSQFEERCIQYN